ncbi:hypothetical protein VPH35_085341 [Triticum aestivum]
MAISSHLGGDGLPSGSASSIIAGAVSGYHLLKIVGYSRTKEVPNGKWIDSCSFQVGGRTWRVRYYPNGDESEYTDKDGKPVPVYTLTTAIKDFSVNKTWGFGSISSTIHSLYAQETPSILVPPSDLHRHLGLLLSSKVGVDVKFRVGRKTFSAHRSVLAARSPVFRAELFGLMKEGTTTGAIRIHDIKPEVFNALLTFMYTDALPAMDKQEESAMAQHLLVAADKHDLERLKLICEEKLCNCIDTSSVATILALAEQHHCHELKATCLVFLSSPNNLDAAIESEGFELLTKRCPGVIKDLLKSQVAPSILGKRKSGA